MASDVKYSMERLLDPDFGATRNTNYVGVVDSVEAVDDHTVVFHLTKPFGPFLTGMPADMLIVNRKFVEEHDGDITRTMMGTGPFMFKEWIPDQVIRLVRNPNYWRVGIDGEPLPYLDGIDFMPNADRTAAIADFEAGTTDFVYMVPEKDVDRLMDNPDVTLAGPDSIWYSSIRVNTEIPPFDDVRVRQAISWAIDRDEIVQVGLFGHADPAYGGSTPAWHWASSDLGVYDHRDLEKAKALLAEAGYPDGEGFPDLEIPAPVNYQNHVIEAEMIASYLQDLGINAKARIVEWSTLLEEAGFGSNFGENTYPMYVCGWIGTGDPHDVLGKMYPSDSEFNFMFNYANPEVDKLLKEAASTTDLDKRADLYSQAEEILVEEVPDIYIDFHHVWHAMHNRVQGFVAMPNQAMYVLDQVWLDN
jgi:peptide/nickel transport system substrate-binding protein